MFQSVRTRCSSTSAQTVHKQVVKHLVNEVFTTRGFTSKGRVTVRVSTNERFAWRNRPGKKYHFTVISIKRCFHDEGISTAQLGIHKQEVMFMNSLNFWFNISSAQYAIKG